MDHGINKLSTCGDQSFLKGWSCVRENMAALAKAIFGRLRKNEAMF